MGKVADLSVFTPGGQPGAPNPSEGLAVLRQNQTAFMEIIGVMPPEALTIVDGAISPTTAVCIVDTEGGAPADDLTTINATLSDGSTLHDGMVILLSAKDASRVVTVKNSDAPNGVKTVDGKDIALSPEWCLVLQYVGGVWQQINVSAPLKPATETTLGGVKVGDGLTMRDGVMSADLATDANAGRVKASEAAKAGAVPLGGADGSLGEDWLKKAMDAAKSAADAAENANNGANEAKGIATWKQKSTRSTTGQWTIAGCRTDKPLIILSRGPNSGETYITISVVSGAIGGDNDKATYGSYAMGRFTGTDGFVSTDCFICLPISETVVIKVKVLKGSAVAIQ